MKKILLYVISIVVILVIGGDIGMHIFGGAKVSPGAVSPSGSTFSSGRVATAEVTTVSTSTLVSLSLPGSDVILTSAFCYLNSLAGIGTDNLLINIKAATSTTPSGLINSAGTTNTNYIANSNLSTSTIPGFNWFRNPMSATTTSIVGNAAGTGLASSTIQWAGGGTTYIDFIADEPLSAGTTGVCGVTMDSL